MLRIISFALVCGVIATVDAQTTSNEYAGTTTRDENATSEFGNVYEYTAYQNTEPQENVAATDPYVTSIRYEWFNDAASKNVFEEIDVFSSILSEDLHVLFASASTKFGVGVEVNNKMLTQPLGTYLGGYGVSIVARTPMLATQSESSSSKGKGEKMSRWERTSRRLRGDLSGTAAGDMGDSCLACHDASSKHAYGWVVTTGQYQSTGAKRTTIENVKKQLADTLRQNGSNFSLKPTEVVSITIEFPSSSQPFVHADYANMVDFYVIDKLRKNNYVPSQIAQGQSPARNMIKAGDLLVKQERYDEAVKAYKKAIEIAPENYETLLKLANVLSQQKQYDQAIKLYKQAVKIAPDNHEVVLNLANTMRLAGQTSDAEQILGRLLKDNHESVQRLFLDLIGIPPTKEDLSELSKEKYWNVITKLLAGSNVAKSRANQNNWNYRLMNPHASIPKPTKYNRLKVSATKAQLDKVASGEISEIEFMRQLKTELVSAR